MNEAPPDNGREVELKLDVEPQDLAALQARVLGGGVKASTTVLRSVYFDTGDGALRKAGVSLRIRSDGARRLQTIKAERDAASMVFDRSEWETPVEGDRPDFAAAVDTALGPLLRDKAVRKAIAPRFEVRVERTAARVAHCGADIEMAFDRGEVAADGRAAAFGEIELELKRGERGALFDLALALGESGAARLGAKAKSERGYELASGGRPHAAKAEAVALSRKMTAGKAFQAIARSCLRQVVLNEAALREAGPHPDAIHQARVGLRRLRAAIGLFKDAVADERRDPIRAELKWMANQLGPARDLDVLLARVEAPGVPGAPIPPETVEDYRRRRERAYAAAIEAVGSPRFRRAILATAAWIEAGPWLSGRGKQRKARRRPVADHAAEALALLWRRIRKRGKRLGEIGAEQRHRVRIEIKKLRYATEFFAGLTTGKRAKERRRAALGCLEELQETLGELNDIAVAGDMTTAGDALRAGAAAPDVVRGLDEHSGALLDKARSAYETFAWLDPFWKPRRRFKAA